MTDDVAEPPRFGPAHKRVAELSDAELCAELQRRAASAGTGTAQPGRAAPPRAALSPRERAQYLANLELPADAGPEQVAKAYERLVERYAPGRQAGDADRRAATERLLASLAEARDALLSYLGAR